MSYKGIAPRVNVDMLNSLVDPVFSSYLLDEYRKIVRKLLDLNIDSVNLKVETGDVTGNRNLFFIGDTGCEIISNFPASVSSNEKISLLVEEHLAIQLLNLLHLHVFRGEELSFVGNDFSGMEYKIDAIGVVFNCYADGEDKSILPLIFYLKVPDSNEIVLGKSSDASEIKVVDILLGNILVDPSELIDLLNENNVISLDKSVDFNNCLLSNREGSYYQGELLEGDKSDIFKFKSVVPAEVNAAGGGRTEIFIRLIKDVDLKGGVNGNFPYLVLGSKFRGKVELLIGGERVGTGVLGCNDEGLIIKVGSI